MLIYTTYYKLWQILFIIAKAVIEDYEKRPNYSRNQLDWDFNEITKKILSLIHFITFHLALSSTLGRFT